MILLRILKNDRSAGVAGWIILSLALFAQSVIHALDTGSRAQLQAWSGMPFYNLLFGKIHTLPLLNHLLTVALFMLIGYVLIRISVRFMLLEFRSVMPAFFFLIFSAALPSAQQISPQLAGSLFFLLCFNLLFDVHDKEPDTFTVFSASLLLALGSMFYLKLIWFLPLIWVSLTTLRNVTWRELFYPVVAYLMMALFLFAWYWGVQGDAGQFASLVRSNMAFTGGFQPYHQSVYIYYGYLLFLIILASIYMVRNFQRRKTTNQIIYQVLFYIFVAGVLFHTLIAKFEPGSLVFIAIPVSFILANYFHRRKGHWLQELALWVMVGLLVWLQWMN